MNGNLQGVIDIQNRLIYIHTMYIQIEAMLLK